MRIWQLIKRGVLKARRNRIDQPGVTGSPIRLEIEKSSLDNYRNRYPMEV